MMFCYIGNLYCGHKAVRIAEYLKKVPSTVTHAIRQIKGNIRVKKRVERLIQKWR